jgi:hypothetical protein
MRAVAASAVQASGGMPGTPVDRLEVRPRSAFALRQRECSTDFEGCP